MSNVRRRRSASTQDDEVVSDYSAGESHSELSEDGNDHGELGAVPSLEDKTPSNEDILASASNDTHEVEIQRIVYASGDSTILGVRFIGNSQLKNYNNAKGNGTGSIIIKNDVLVNGNPEIGDRFAVAGNIKEYRGQPQIKVNMLNPIIKLDDFQSTKKWLSRFVKNVGVSTAQKIADYFGDDLTEALSNYDLLKTMPGLKPEIAEEIYNTYMRTRDYNELFIYLSSFKNEHRQILRKTTIDNLIKSYGAAIKDVIDNDPWHLADFPGIGFESADKIAMQSGRKSDDLERIVAGVKHVLKHKCAEEGHTCLPEDNLIAMSKKLLDINESKIKDSMGEIRDDAGIHYDGERKLYAHASVREQEQAIADKIVDMLKRGPRMDRKKAEELVSKNLKMSGFKKDESQFNAMVDALVYPFMVLTGGPGTGKSTVQNVFLKCVKTLRERFSASCPTGQGAKRLAEASESDASTCHRQLGFNPDAEEFKFNATNPLPVDRVIVDEVSMLDNWLTYSLLEAFHNELAACFVGDFNQLPSVGSGQVLRDIIMSGLVPVDRLETTHRQAKKSGIPIVAQRILDREMPFKKGEKLRGVEHIECNDGDIVRNLADLVTKKMPLMGLDPEQDIMILTSKRKDENGVSQNNSILKHLINPAIKGDDKSVDFRYGGGKDEDGEVETITMTLGDLIMQLKNNYNHNIFNGEVGTVSGFSEVPVVDKDGKATGKYQTAPVVNFKGREITLNPIGEINKDSVIHANNNTVHKSQGSESPIVIVLMPEAHSFMLDVNLLYTAETRGKSKAFFIGPERSFYNALTKNNTGRYTSLKDMLQERIPEVRLAWDKMGINPDFLDRNEDMIEDLNRINQQREERRKDLIATYGGKSRGVSRPTGGRVLRGMGSSITETNYDNNMRAPVQEETVADKAPVRKPSSGVVRRVVKRSIFSPSVSNNNSEVKKEPEPEPVIATATPPVEHKKVADLPKEEIAHSPPPRPQRKVIRRVINSKKQPEMAP